MLSEKQLTTTGKMPVVRMVRTNIFGLWPLSNSLTATTKLLARNLLALPRKLLAKLLTQKAQNLQLAKLLLTLKNPNNFRIFVKELLPLGQGFFYALRAKIT